MYGKYESVYLWERVQITLYFFFRNVLRDFIFSASFFKICALLDMVVRWATTKATSDESFDADALYRYETYLYEREQIVFSF